MISLLIPSLRGMGGTGEKRLPSKAAIFFSCLFVVLGVSAQSAEVPAHWFDKAPDERSVSLIRLIADPQAFDERNVVVQGFLVLRDEYENSLFIDENAYLAGLSSNSIAVDLEDSSAMIATRAQELDKRYVRIAGKFHVGPTAFSSGLLKAIYRLGPTFPEDE